MAGARKNPTSNGKYQAWYVDYHGRRKFFIGTHNRLDTIRIAERLEDEHRQIRLGYRPPPTPAMKHAKCAIAKIIEEYLAWGCAQGGRGGRPWASGHAKMRKTHLKWWKEKLGLEILADLPGVLPRVEKAIRSMLSVGRANKTVQNYAESLKGLCNWCVEREYLNEYPLKALKPLDTTPRTRRRAMTADEIKLLLIAAPEYRRLLYEVAFTTGLRAGELRALTTKHLDTERGGLNLDADWTKNRKSGFQPLPSYLVGRLESFGKAATASNLYKQSKSKIEAPRNPLLYVPKHTARIMHKDLKKAGIPQETSEGKLDFHACRVAYITFLLDTGANAKELQTLARHSHPEITMDKYARTRDDRLAKLTEKVAETALLKPLCANSVHQSSSTDNYIQPNLLHNKGLRNKKTQNQPRFEPRLPLSSFDWTYENRNFFQIGDGKQAVST